MIESSETLFADWLEVRAEIGKSSQLQVPGTRISGKQKQDVPIKPLDLKRKLPEAFSGPESDKPSKSSARTIDSTTFGSRDLKRKLPEAFSGPESDKPSKSSTRTISSRDLKRKIPPNVPSGSESDSTVDDETAPSRYHHRRMIKNWGQHADSDGLEKRRKYNADTKDDTAPERQGGSAQFASRSIFGLGHSSHLSGEKPESTKSIFDSLSKKSEPKSSNFGSGATSAEGDDKAPRSTRSANSAPKISENKAERRKILQGTFKPYFAELHENVEDEYEMRLEALARLRRREEADPKIEDQKEDLLEKAVHYARRRYNLNYDEDWELEKCVQKRYDKLAGQYGIVPEPLIRLRDTEVFTFISNPPQNNDEIQALLSWRGLLELDASLEEEAKAKESGVMSLGMVDMMFIENMICSWIRDGDSKVAKALVLAIDRIMEVEL
ncbi:uncharacterized protein PAC_05615 [Phialocephala subalpina]|uniref:Uncharacterized protein n=1 Tax=Phialocephala subalpina TaxID=576137 RepID=A0A1L7WSI2_9HELO|nr:uncharacterized protein PAC_05615 [Phialocephala subalpina]